MSCPITLRSLITCNVMGLKIMLSFCESSLVVRRSFRESSAIVKALFCIRALSCLNCHLYLRLLDSPFILPLPRIFFSPLFKFLDIHGFLLPFLKTYRRQSFSTNSQSPSMASSSSSNSKALASSRGTSSSPPRDSSHRNVETFSCKP